jgi:hypothetical protein
VFGVGEIPGDSRLREVVDEHSYEPLYGVFEEYFKRLQRGKHLEGYRFLKEHHLLSVDGTQYFGSEKIGCMKCLRTKTKDHTCLTQDIEGMRRGGLLSSHEETDKKGKPYRYEGVNTIPVNSFHCRLTTPCFPFAVNTPTL